MKMYRLNMLVLTLVMVLMLGLGSALAQIPSFDELDQDGNDFVNQSEASTLPCLAENYDQIKPADDQGLDRQEYRQAVSRYCAG